MRIIYTDTDRSWLEEFRHAARNFPEIDSLMLFSSADETTEYVKENKTDIAFININSVDCGGLYLIEELMQIDESIRIIFVSDSPEFAMSAFTLDAVGYLLKPYSTAALRKEFDKALRMQPKNRIDVVIETIPDFVVKIKGKVAIFSRPKVEELLALLVNQGDAGLTSGEAIAYLWPDRASDDSTTALYRTTASRLIEALKAWGISDILVSDGKRRYIDTKLVDCDLYRILAGETAPLIKYSGEFMRKYSWAEDRNAWLWHLDNEHVRK